MPENTTLYQVRLNDLRKEIENLGLDGFILPRTDEFQGEFLAPYAERLAWLTGFTGSAGMAIILKDKAAVLSDGRYTIQLDQQVAHNLYERIDSTKIPPGEWLDKNAAKGARIGYDMWLITPVQLEKLKEKAQNIEFVALKQNPLDTLWKDQPAKPCAPVTLFPDSVAGQTSAQKRAAIAKEIKGDACLLTLCDSLCWLLNVRGADIDYSPLMHSYALLYADSSLDWFIDDHKLSPEIIKHLGHQVKIKSPEDISQNIVGKAITMDRKTAPIWFEHQGAQIIDAKDPCIYPKSIKTASEQEAIKKAHILDGVAIIKFLIWLEEATEPMDELSIEEKLESFRRKCADYQGPSFSTIAGFAQNGAIVHYRATPKTCMDIKGDGLLLVDSGGQYRWGTTDITRTILVGKASKDMIEHYTRVLKGHIALASAIFKRGTIGKEIDALARAPLQEVGLDYAHGTGHGVGCYLGVHEEAASISPRGEQPLEQGMLISNEPGYYREGAYGIRLENLVLVQKAQKDSLCFETVTLAPFEAKLIDVKMLSAKERTWLNQYGAKTIENLSPLLNKKERQWLECKFTL